MAEREHPAGCRATVVRATIGVVGGVLFQKQPNLSSIGDQESCRGLLATVMDCIGRESWTMAVIFAAGGAWLLWYGWRWSR